MLSGSELALDKAQIERSTNRRAAVIAKGGLMGYKFIRLKLNNIRKRRVSGVDVLRAVEFQNNEMGGIIDYHLELSGGDLDFDYRPEFGMYLCDMLDTDRNRQFLATHFEYKFWDIIEKFIFEDVEARYQKIKEELLNKLPVESDQKTDAQKFWDEVREHEEKMRRMTRGEESPTKPDAPKTFETDTPPDTQATAALTATVQPKKRGWPAGKPRPAYKLTNGRRIEIKQKLNAPQPEPEVSDALRFAPAPEAHGVGVGVNAP
jgi:hypothetical protein